MPKLEVALPDEDLLKRGRRAGAESVTTPPPGLPRRRICRPPPAGRLLLADGKNGDSGASGLATGTGGWGSSPGTWRRFAKRYTCTQSSGPTRTLARRSGCSSLSGRVGTSPTGRSKGPSGGRSPAAARWQRPYSCATPAPHHSTAPPSLGREGRNGEDQGRDGPTPLRRRFRILYASDPFTTSPPITKAHIHPTIKIPNDDLYASDGGKRPAPGPMGLPIRDSACGILETPFSRTRVTKSLRQ